MIPSVPHFADAAVCVVMASKGYPGSYESGKVIAGLDEAAAMQDVRVFHSGTKLVEHLTFTATPDTLDAVKAELLAFKSAGLSSISLRLYEAPAKSMELLAREILPVLS